MCGRFTLTVPPEVLAAHFELESVPAAELVAPRYNIAPTQEVAAIRLTRRGKRRLDMLRWGLVPHWAKDTSIGARLINARAESLADKPAFRLALRRRRCLIPASGFYEWLKRGTSRGQPHLLRASAARPLAFAGLWERWSAGGDGPDLDSCTIITVEASSEVTPIHSRMPALLEPEDFQRWLARDDDGSVGELLRPRLGLVAQRVSERVNSDAIDDPACVEPPLTLVE